MPRLTVVVPCYNEAERLDRGPLLAFVDGHPDASLLLVDDGSSDATGAVLNAVAAERPGRVRALSLTPNRGKAEAVRQGMTDALAAGAEIVGYLDADLSTPPAEIDDLLAALARPGVQVAIGARVGMLGYDIDRSAVRHYLGRVFATAASLILRARVYDTQCGAKLFRAGPALSAALAGPFLSRWAFDVELLGRLLIGTPDVTPLPLSAIVEVPLTVWHDIKGSKLGLAGMARTLRDLAMVAADLNARRRAAAR
ncbi:MAG TPA: glycosyltransferase [Polyangia bacterium]|nr:glycosyltransferase [Polyangia bacterium]